MTFERFAVSWSLACLCALAAGCSVPASFQQGRDAAASVREADEETADGEYEAAIGSYLKARRLLLAMRENGYWVFSDEKKLASIDEKIGECERLAEEDGLVRVGTRYLRGGEVGAALTGELRRFFRDAGPGPGAAERVVADELTASCAEGADGKYDVTIAVVMRSAMGEGDFDQDAWGLVRFLMEGCWGYGFTFHTAERFAARSYMGGTAGWGRSAKESAENRIVGLKGRVGRLTVSVSKGESRQEPGDGYGARGYRSLEAVGPYWRKEPYRSYTMKSADAEGLNWGEADRIPDATLYGLMTVAAQGGAGK